MNVIQFMALVESYNELRSKCEMKVSACLFIAHPDGLWPETSTSPWLAKNKRPIA